MFVLRKQPKITNKIRHATLPPLAAQLGHLTRKSIRKKHRSNLFAGLTFLYLHILYISVGQRSGRFPQNFREIDTFFSGQMRRACKHKRSDPGEDFLNFILAPEPAWMSLSFPWREHDSMFAPFAEGEWWAKSGGDFSAALRARWAKEVYLHIESSNAGAKTQERSS